MESSSITNIDEGTATISTRFSNIKALIVLDDVDDKFQLQKLVEKRNWFGSGTRIIITTRNKRILDFIQVDWAFEHISMDPAQALQLFSKHAFRDDKPRETYEELSTKIVKTTGGLPLALEIVGSLLCGKDMKYWHGILKKLEKVPREEVVEKLKISFETLDERHKHIFLDIACFFIGTDHEIVTYYWDDPVLFPEEAIEHLQEMSLIKIREDNLLWMHDQLRDYGRDIVCREDIINPKNRSRLWNKEEATQVMTKGGTERVQGIQVNGEALNNTASLNEALAKFSNVRLFWATRIPSFSFLNPSNSPRENPRVSLNYPNQSSNSLLENPRVFSELRWLSWERFPHKYIKASNFSLLNLTILNLSSSDFTIKWEGWSQIKMAKNLKVLDLSWCKNLKRTPNFSSHLQLEQLILSHCSALKKIDESIGMLKFLVHLDLRSCEKLRKLPEELGYMESLTELHLSYCGLIVEIPQLSNMVQLEVFDADSCFGLKSCISLNNLTSLKKLLLEYTEISLIPDSIGELVHLVELNLNGCFFLKKLPESIGGLVSLTHLYLCESRIKKLPNSIGYLKNLIVLDVSYTPIRELPSTIEMAEKLEKIDAEGSGLLSGGVPMLPKSLINLTLPVNIMDSVPNLSNQINLVNFCLDRDDRYDECAPIEEASRDWAPIESPSPEWIGNLSKAKRLDLAFPQFTTLHPDLGSLSQLTDLRLVCCVHLQNIPTLPSELTSLEFDHCCMMSGIDELPENLQKLEISNCEKLRSLPQMSQYKKLERFCLRKCPNVVEIHGRLESLKQLEISDCENLRSLPQMSEYKKLERFCLRECPNVVEIHGRLESLKQLKISDCENLRSLPQMSEYKKLKCFSLRECPNVVEIHGRLESLEQLIISDCENLGSLRQMSQYKKLESFYLRGCPNVVEIHGRLESLKELTIFDCENLSSLPQMSQYNKLESFCLDGCPNVIEIHGRLESLKQLEISNCENLRSLPQMLQYKPEHFYLSGCPNLVEIEWMSQCSCSYSQNEEVKGKGKRKWEWFET